MFRPAPELQRLHVQDKPKPKAPAPPSQDWLDEDERSWKMIPIGGAASYIFSLMTSKDYVLMSTRIQAGDANSVEVTLPADLKLQPKQQYVWRLHGFRDDGKLIKSHWGITTMLTAEDEALLIADEKDLLEEDGTLPDDEVQLALLVETYRKHGILQNAAEMLRDNLKLNSQPGADEMRAEIIEIAGPYAQMLDT